MILRASILLFALLCAGCGGDTKDDAQDQTKAKTASKKSTAPVIAGIGFGSGGRKEAESETDTSPDAAETSDSETPLDEQVVAIFKHRCAMCHDDLGAGAGGDVAYLKDLAEVADPDGYLIDADDPTESHLRTIIVDGDMPKERMKDIEWNGPLTDAEKATVLRWIDQGAPLTSQKPTETNRDWVENKDVRSAIARDLESMRNTDAGRTRYISLVNLWNDHTITDAELETYRAAVVKLLNGLSQNPEVLGLDTSNAKNKLVAVNDSRTLFRFDLSDVDWTRDQWQRIAACYPFARRDDSGTGRIVSSLSGTNVAVIRADWFVFTASQPPLYHELLGIPQNLDTLERQLGVRRLANIEANRVDRAGFGKSKVSVNNRLIERHAMPRSGAYWISYDFRKNDGAQNLFRNPLGPPCPSQRDLAFEHDGGEVIYTLPNGFQAYVLVTAEGDRLDIAPTSIVHDDSMPGGVIINGISCMSCHYAGMKPENRAELMRLDRVRESVMDNFRDFNEEQRERVGEIYPSHERMAELIETDSAMFQAAMKRAGLEDLGTTEPVRALFDRFARDVTPESAAAGLGIKLTDFADRMSRETETRQMMARLRDEGVRRQLYIGQYGRLAQLTGQGDAMASDGIRIPYFGNETVGGVAPVVADRTTTTRPRASHSSTATRTHTAGFALPSPTQANAALTALLVKMEAEFSSAKKPTNNEEKYQQAVMALLMAETAALVSDTPMDENLSMMIFRLMALRPEGANLNHPDHLSALSERHIAAVSEMFKLVEAGMLKRNGQTFTTMFNLYNKETQWLLRSMKQAIANARYRGQQDRAASITKLEQKLGSFFVTHKKMVHELDKHPEQHQLWRLALKMEDAVTLANRIDNATRLAITIDAAERFNAAMDWTPSADGKQDQRMLMLHTTAGPAMLKQFDYALSLPNPEPMKRLMTVFMNIIRNAPDHAAMPLRDQFNAHYANRVHGLNIGEVAGSDVIEVAGNARGFVVYEFGASWNKSSRENAPEIAKIQNALGEDRVSVVLVEVNAKGKSNSKSLIQDLRLSGVKFERLNRYVDPDEVPAQTLPVTVVCDPSGRILMSHAGAFTDKGVSAFIERMTMLR